MRIAVDARVLERKMTGIGRYLMDFVSTVEKIDHSNEYILFSTLPLQNINKNYFQNVVLNKYKVNNKLYSPFWLNFILKKYLLKNNYDLFFSPNNLCPVGNSINFKRVVTIHDVQFKIDNKYYSFYYRNYLNLVLKQAINAADKIITISNSSKRDLIKYFNIGEDKIQVIYRAADPKFRKRDPDKNIADGIRMKYKLPNNYLLYVGVIDNRKNIYSIIKISDKISALYPDVKFVLIGKPHYGYDNIKREIDKRKNSIIYLEYVNDDDLPYIYNMAKIFLFTSFYEGFGLPVLEAMQSGIPVITSNTSSLPEIVGDNGIMHDPNDIEGFVGSILFLLENGKKYKEYCDKALIGSKYFNTQNIIKKHVELFNVV